MSNGRDRKLDDISHTRGTPFVSGMNGNSTPVPSPNDVQNTPMKLYTH